MLLVLLDWNKNPREYRRGVSEVDHADPGDDFVRLAVALRWGVRPAGGLTRFLVQLRLQFLDFEILVGGLLLQPRLEELDLGGLLLGEMF